MSNPIKMRPDLFSLNELIQGRLFTIPQYQRSYSWKKEHRKNLFDDIQKSYNKGNATENHFMATIVGLYRDKQSIMTDEYRKIDIVDGQQRITTLILLYKAISRALNRSKKEEKRAGEEIDEILVKPDDVTPTLLLQTNHDGNGYFFDYIRNENHLPPQPHLAKTVAGYQLLSAIKECEDFVKYWKNEGNSLLDLYAHLKNRLHFIFYEIGDERLVYSVFEVLNSRGLPVSWLDRLKSMLMAVVFDHKTDGVIDEVHDLWADIYRILGLRLGLSTEALRFAATLRHDNSQSRALNEERAVRLLFDQSKDNPSSVIETTKWIKSVTEVVDKLTADHRRNAVTRIVQARLVAVAINLRDDLAEDEKEQVLRRWENVTFRIYGLYGKDARTAVGNYVRLAWEIKNEKLPIDDIMDRLSDIGKEYPPDKAVEELRKQDWYSSRRRGELLYFFRRYEEHLKKNPDRTLTASTGTTFGNLVQLDQLNISNPKALKYPMITFTGWVI